MEFWLQHSSGLLLIDYFGLIVGVSLLECIFPLRKASDVLSVRWLNNIGITIVNFIVIRSIFPMLGVGMAMLSSQRGWGLFSRVQLPGWVEAIAVFLALDLMAYAMHYMFHRSPLLWRIHRTHHTDQDFDFTTAFRFHPFEAILTTVANLAAIAMLGPRPVIVLAAQILNTAQTFLEHGNYRMPVRFERALKLCFVTSGMHRIHHSSDNQEGRSNFSSVFSWWDRLFNTYIDQPKVPSKEMGIGIAEFQGRKHLTLPWIVAQPFLRKIIR